MRSLLLAVFVACSSLMLQAQNVNGIRVDAGNHLVVVYMNGHQISLPTSSCFIANLTHGRYAIEVYDATNYRSGRHNHRGKLLYRESVRYMGRGIKDIIIKNHIDNRPPYPSFPDDDAHYPGGHYPHNVMSSKAFSAFYKEFKDLSFESKQLKLLETAVVNTRFTSEQCEDLIATCSFDSSRLKFMKILYPAVVDKQNFFMVIEKFDFESYKDRMNKFIQEYHRTHRR